MLRKRAARVLLALLAALALSGCYSPFEPGQVVHHKLDGLAAVVVSCEVSACRVSRSDWVLTRTWRLIEIRERPAPRE